MVPAEAAAQRSRVPGRARTFPHSNSARFSTQPEEPGEDVSGVELFVAGDELICSQQQTPTCLIPGGFKLT